MMADRKLKALFICGIIMFLCGLLMVGIQIHGWATEGEKLRLGTGVVLVALSSVFMAASRHRQKSDK